MVVPDLELDSHALLTRPPLSPKRPFDLHVLSIPPAFILSQDQTLHFVFEFVAPMTFCLGILYSFYLITLGFNPTILIDEDCF